MKKVLLFVTLLIGGVSYSQNNLSFNQIRNVSVDTVLLVSMDNYTNFDFTEELFLYKVPDSCYTKINDILESNYVGTVADISIEYGVLIENKRFSIDDMKGFWLTSGQEISAYIRYYRPNPNNNYPYINAQFSFIGSFTEYIVSPN